MKLAIVDYGMGNIKSISSALKYLGVKEVVLSADFDVMKSADKIILPGVGSYGKAMNHIKDMHLDEHLRELVINLNKPILGICLGMQLMAKSSNEDGDNEGLGMIDAIVRKFEITDIKIPHVGFNQVSYGLNSRLYSGIKANPDFYFTHSYRMMSEADVNQSFCEYGERFVSSFEKDNIAGVQFHPELSQTNGLQLLSNFIEKF